MKKLLNQMVTIFDKKLEDLGGTIGKVSLSNITQLSIILGSVLIVAGCTRSANPNFYTLTPQLAPLVRSNVKLIQVMPVNLPERLNTPLINVQKSDGVTYVLDSQRWSSSLADELQSALSAGLQQKLGAVDVYNTGLTGNKVSYLISPSFSKFDIVEESQKSGYVEVMASWVIKRIEPIQLSDNNLRYKQFNCRMNLKNVIDSNNSNFITTIGAYQKSVNQVTEAIAISVFALDAQRVPSMSGMICS